MRIAILDDDNSETFIIEHCLISAGHTTQRFARPADFQKIAKSADFDALVMNWSANDQSGIQVLGRLREKLSQRHISLPILLITSHTSEDYVVKALRAGADDYIPRPIRRHELLARLDSVTRRNRSLPSTARVFDVGEFRIDTASRRIFLDGAPVELSIKEFDLAVFLLTKVGRLYTRSYIKQSVWGKNVTLKSRTLDTHMSRVRKKLMLTEENGWRLTAVYRRGYRLERVNPCNQADAD